MKKIKNNSPNWSDDTLIIQKENIGWDGFSEPQKHFYDQKKIIKENNVIKGKINFSTKKYLFGFNFYLSLYMLFILIFIFISIKCVLGCENNLTISQEEDITRQQLISFDQEAIEEQKKSFDFYEKQKELIDENSRLRDIIEKEEQIKKQHSIAQPSTAKNLENVGKQVVKETDRVVQKTNREVKRILKKF